MEFAELVRKRRTVRRFEATPVDREVLEGIARLAQRTPSAGFAQGQRVIIVTDPEQRRRVAETCDEAAYVEMGMGPWISECAAQFIPCVSRDIYLRRYAEPDKLPEGEEQDTNWPTPYWWVDIGKTSMVVMLAAHDAGLANVLVFHAIRLLGPTRITAYQFLVPFIAVVLGATFIGEPIRTAQIAGGAVIVGGVALTRARSIDVGGWLRELLPD